MKYIDNPVLFNKMFQGQEWYIGVDNLVNSALKKGDLIVALEMPNGGGNYFLPLGEFKKFNLNVTALCQGVQVGAFYKKDVTGLVAQYKPTARLYAVNQELKIAIGNTIANPQYGPGGITQILVPHGLEITKDAYKNYKHPDYTKQPTLIPVNLNNYKSDPRFSSSTQFEIEEISNLYKDNTNKIDDYIDLNNKDISLKVYDTMNQKRIVHKQVVTYNCLMKEYTDELKNPEIDLKYSEELKIKLNKFEMKINSEKDILNKQILRLQKTPDLLKGMSNENIEHLLNSENCCPKTTMEHMAYLKNKLQFLENNLSIEEKIKLNIDILEKKDSTNCFKVATSKEQEIKEMYKDVTRESDPKVKALDHRELVHTLNVDPFKRELLCNLKAKDNLIAIAMKTDDLKVKKICSEQLKKVNSNLDKVEGQIASRGIIDKTTFDVKVDYLKQKVNNLRRYLPENKLLNNEYKEKQINELSINILASGKIAGCKSLNTINEFCNISTKVIAEEKEIREMSKIHKQIDILEKDKTNLVDIKNTLETKGITNWDGYNKAIEIHKEKVKYLEHEKSLHSPITDKSAINQRLELAKSKKEQRGIFKPPSISTIAKTKIVGHKKDFSLEM